MVADVCTASDIITIGAGTLPMVAAVTVAA